MPNGSFEIAASLKLGVGILLISSPCTLGYFLSKVVTSPAFRCYSWMHSIKGPFSNKYLTCLRATVQKLFHQSQLWNSKGCNVTVCSKQTLCCLHKNGGRYHERTITNTMQHNLKHKNIKWLIWPTKWDICKPLQKIV